MADSTLIVSVTGILVSGVVGPAVSTWAARRTARRQFLRDRAAGRMAELGSILDEAASLLGLGVTRLRQTREASLAGSQLGEDLRTYPEEVYVVGQRLRLRLGGEDPIVKAFEEVRASLVEASECPDDDESAHEAAAVCFEENRERFLTAARARLSAPISEKETP